MKKAILTVSFGTSYPDTLEKTIVPIENDLAAAFPDRMHARAFTSKMIIRKIARRDGVQIDTVPQALERLLGKGVTDVLIQPTHVIPGEEWEILCAEAAPYRSRFEKMTIGSPLLLTIDDHQAVAEALLTALPEKTPNQAVVLMGHGSEHHANSVYATLEYRLHDMGRTDVLIGTVEGYPGFPEVSRRLRERNVRDVFAAALMVVAGDHAKNDLAGEDSDSWKSMLEQQGYRVHCSLAGMGENPEIRKIFVRHAEMALQ